MGIEEVLVKMHASAGSRASRAANASLFGPGFSTMASITVPVSPRSSTFVVQWMRP
jgi:hypothetical protein